MKKIFVVDDSTTSLIAARNALEGSYDVYAMPSAERMFKLLEKITPDLILLDVDMPEMDGFKVLSILKSNGSHSIIPVVFLTGKNDVESELRGFDMGAVDFIIKPFSPPILTKRIQSHIEIGKLVKQSLQSVQKIYHATINNIAEMVESRDMVTGGHIERTQTYLTILVTELLLSGIYEMEVSAWDMSILIPSAQLHDVGKVKTSDFILNKPGKLTYEEFELIKWHCIDGEEIIDRIISETGGDTFLLHAKRFAGTHHEKWNGTGYPRKLRGREIPLEGRIMAIVDVYDALVSERPYKKPYTHKRAVEIIENESGEHFDPELVKIFLSVADEFEATLGKVDTAQKNRQQMTIAGTRGI